MSQILIYQSEAGRTKLDGCLKSQIVWLSQKQLTEHIKHAFPPFQLGIPV